MGRGLSRDQEQIIRWAGGTAIRDREYLARRESAIRGDGLSDISEDNRCLSYLQRHTAWGAEWNCRERDATPSRRAATSRALRRLEARGLVRRMYYDRCCDPEDEGPPWRTTHVQLTDSGWALYDRLKAEAIAP